MRALVLQAIALKEVIAFRENSYAIEKGRSVHLLFYNAFPAPGSTGISVNGQRARNNNFTIDGTDNNDISVTLSTVSNIPEAVAEFQVQTNASGPDQCL